MSLMPKDPIAAVYAEIEEFLTGQGVPADLIAIEAPPEASMGEAATSVAFRLARERKRSPRDIASQLASSFDPKGQKLVQSVEPAVSGFINFRIDFTAFIPVVFWAIEAQGKLYGRPDATVPARFMVEHTSVNPNKEWHAGHLRNAILGDTLARLATLAGHSVEIQNYIDDTGRQAAEAVFALERYNADLSEQRKFDHLVGEYYVRLNEEMAAHGQEEGRKSEYEAGINRVLRQMEEGVYRHTIDRVLRAQMETAFRIGARYDLLVWESDIVGAHLLDEALTRLKRSQSVSNPDEGEYGGALVIAMPPRTAADEPQMRVLVRSNGLPTYTGKDIAYMMWKFGLLKGRLSQCQWMPDIDTTCPEGAEFSPTVPDEVINVVGEHQALQQQTVIEALRAAGYTEQAMRARHLSYGMVSQVHGRISGRKGSGSSADVVLDEAVDVAFRRVKEKQPDLDDSAVREVAESIAVGAVRYLMVQYSPGKPIVFDLENVVSFEGNTGLYIQYAVVRMRSILRRARDQLEIDDSAIDSGELELLDADAEKRLLLKMSKFPEAVSDALRTMGMNLAAEYAHELAAEFSQFYRDCVILQAEPTLRLARLRLLRAACQVLTNAAAVLGLPLVERL